jgi:hypothetical protein
MKRRERSRNTLRLLSPDSTNAGAANGKREHGVARIAPPPDGRSVAEARGGEADRVPMPIDLQRFGHANAADAVRTEPFLAAECGRATLPTHVRPPSSCPAGLSPRPADSWPVRCGSYHSGDRPILPVPQAPGNLAVPRPCHSNDLLALFDAGRRSSPGGLGSVAAVKSVTLHLLGTRVAVRADRLDRGKIKWFIPAAR